MNRVLALLALSLAFAACGEDDPAGSCGATPEGLDCFDACSGSYLAPVCVGGAWRCNLPECQPVGECGEFPHGADCFDVCLGQYVEPSCVDGAWDCNYTECEPGPCPEPTAPGDVCMGTGWDSKWCEPTEAAAEGCPAVLCTTCNHFEAGTFTTAGCSCSCDGGQFTCRSDGT